MSSHDELHHFIHNSSILSPHSQQEKENSPSYSSSFASVPYFENAPVYKFVKNLQLGSYGKVVLAKDLTTNSPVAIKVIPKPGNHSSFMARHELSILRKLQTNPHQNICQLLDFFQTANYHWFVFEYCSNGDLYDYIANKENDSKPLHFKTLVKELVQVLNYSHSRGIYHRDIKPENILIDSSKSIKLTDWGLSTLTIISEDPCVGTEKYMAPETFFKPSRRSSRSVSYNTKYADYWSLGITLLYVLFKRCPWKLANLSDPNFKSFTQDPFVLFEWYPKLSNFGFDCILSLLQLNPIHRSLDRFYENAIINGYKESFILEDTFTYKSSKNDFTSKTSIGPDSYYNDSEEEEQEEEQEEEEDDMLFGMDIEDSPISTSTQTLAPTLTLTSAPTLTLTSAPTNKVVKEGDHTGSFFDEIFDIRADDDTSNSYYDEILTPTTQSLQTPTGSHDIGLKMKTLCIGDVNPGDKHQPQQLRVQKLHQPHNGNSLFLPPSFVNDDTRSRYRKMDTFGW